MTTNRRQATGYRRQATGDGRIARRALEVGAIVGVMVGVGAEAWAGWIESPPLASLVGQAKRQMLLVRIGTRW